MENKKIFYVLLSFLPILIYPVSFPISLLITFSLVMFAILFVKEETIIKQMLRPLLLTLAVGALFLGFNFFFEVIHGFGNLFAGYVVSGFRLFLVGSLAFLNTIMLLILAGGVVLIILGYATGTRVILFDDVIDGILRGTCPFKKTKTAKTTKSKMAKSEKETNIEPEVVVEENKEEK